MSTGKSSGWELCNTIQSTTKTSQASVTLVFVFALPLDGSKTFHSSCIISFFSMHTDCLSFRNLCVQGGGGLHGRQAEIDSLPEGAGSIACVLEKDKADEYERHRLQQAMLRMFTVCGRASPRLLETISIGGGRAG